MTAKKKTNGAKGAEATSETPKRTIPEITPGTSLGFPIVGIGASAGGLAAFEAFFSAMPTDTESGMAFVLVQHLAPDHKSILSDLVKRYTRMRVFDVEDGMVLSPDCAYIIPPNRDMAFFEGTLRLLESSAPRGQRLPIDFFFRSLAKDQHERAICIILSGTGSDGTLGMRAIKGEGGMAMAQKPESTGYDGMPRSAIATGLVDYVLQPAEMPAQLIAYATHAFGKSPPPASTPVRPTEEGLKKVFLLLRGKTGHDFSQYKQNTVDRRVERRMAVQQIDRLDGYVRYLEETPAEVEALFRDLLIGVTNFFRDPEAFDALEQRVIPQIFAEKAPGTAIRVWVAGCSTGEEAYSIAILLRERMEALRQSFKLQVFATDIDDRAIDVARAGIYPASIGSEVSPERLARFFSQEDGSTYRIHKLIRDLLVFSEQDVIKDPPFSKVDLISCRNLLIYMSGDLQKKLVPLFHYALKPSGVLFLGTSETVGDFADLFTTLDRKAKLYQRKDDHFSLGRPPLGRFLPPSTDVGSSVNAARRTMGESRVPLRELTERAILENAAAGALVDESGDLLYVRGHTGQFLEPAPGEVVTNILTMAREGLKRDLTIALRKAAARKETVRQAGLRVKANGHFITVNLSVRPVSPVPRAASEPRLFLVQFEEAPPADSDRLGKSGARIDAKTTTRASDADTRVARLMQELKVKEQYLQTTQEEMQTSNEELKSSNEELQSTNDELETSKEELQSVNDELATVNTELQTKVADLSRVNNDMNNLLAGTGIGTIFVDHQLRIQRFTPAVTQLINLIQTDIGRPVGHIVSNLASYDRLVSDVRSVLDDLVPKEVEVQTLGGAWFLLRIRPYRALENVIGGAVITFTEISEITKAREVQLESEALRRVIGLMRDAHDAITIQDLDGRILAWNPGAVRMYGFSEPEALGMNISALVPDARRAEVTIAMRRLLRSKVLEPYRTQRIAKAGRIVEISLTVTALVNQAGEVYALATTERGIP